MEPEGSTSYPSLVALGLRWRELLTELSRETVLKALEPLELAPLLRAAVAPT